MAGTLPCHLAGLSVLVTRPEGQAHDLCELIEQAHGRPLRFPALEILGPEDKHLARQRLQAASTADVLIFVSSNAVRYAFPLLPQQLPLEQQIAAVGAATARALDTVGLPPTLIPERMDSEGLLALPALAAVDGRRVLVVRGNAGRELIESTLRSRGAAVEQIEVYRRRRPHRVGATANLVRNWDHLVDVVTVTSIAILDNLFAMLGENGAELLRRTPLLAASQRIAAHAVEIGCEELHVADSATDADLLRALCQLEPGLRPKPTE